MTSFHGGQIHDIDNLVLDLSVTTNGIGPVESAMKKVKDDFLSLCDHYPPTQDTDSELRKGYASFMWEEECKDHDVGEVLFGNGASELIDLSIRTLSDMAIRSGVNNLTWKTNNVGNQFKEYENACSKYGIERASQDTSTYVHSDGLTHGSSDDSVDGRVLSENADLTVIINPCNPSGEFLPWEVALFS